MSSLLRSLPSITDPNCIPSTWHQSESQIESACTNGSQSPPFRQSKSPRKKTTVTSRLGAEEEQVKDKCTDGEACVNIDRIRDRLHDILQHALVSEMPLLDFCWIDPPTGHLAFVVSQFQPDVRSYFNHTLHGLDNAVFEIANKPHTCTIFELCSESGSYVNIYDWWEAFRDKNAHLPTSTNACLTSFHRGMSELCFMGLCKYTKRQKDHVMKSLYLWR